MITQGLTHALQTRLAALKMLKDFGAVMEGPSAHFDFGNGFHGNVYINPHAIFSQPERIWKLLGGLIDDKILPDSVVKATQIVMGPERGGAKLAGWMQGPIDARHDLKDTRVLVAELHKDTRDPKKLFVPAFFRPLIVGKQVLLVDDVRNTGETLKQSADRILEAGGVLIATTVLYDRMNLRPEYTIRDDKGRIPHYALAEYEDGGQLWSVDECPLCRLNVPITKF